MNYKSENHIYIDHMKMEKGICYEEDVYFIDFDFSFYIGEL